MTKSIYLNPTEAYCGKSLVTLGLIEHLLRNTQKVGIFRPIIKKRRKDERDKDIDLVLTHFKLNLDYEETYGFTEDRVHDLEARGKHDDIVDHIIRKYKALEERLDFIVIEGSDYESKNSVQEFNLNLEIAKNLGSPVIVIGRADEENPIEELVYPITQTVETFGQKGCQVVKVIVNRVPNAIHDDLEQVLVSRLPKHLKDFDLIPQDEVLNSPTVGEIAEALGAKVLYGENQLNRLAYYNTIAAMQPHHYLGRVKENCLVITPGDRGDIVMTTLQAHQSVNYPSFAGILLTTGFHLEEAYQKLLEGLPDMIPIMSVETNTYDTARLVSNVHSYIKPINHKKIALALQLFDKNVKARELFENMSVMAPSNVLTPKMFEYNLFKKAKSNKKRIVLPEGEDERILRAAEVLVSKDLVEVIILGDEDQIIQHSNRLGITFDPKKVKIINPVTYTKLSDYVVNLYELRKHKGVNLDMAKDLLSDATYFGTMMVLMGDADGMVSGAVNTTQHTIRPALQLIKTKPGFSVVSSVFFMCLEEKVLVYGDCAVNPNPSAEQLAEIALSSSETTKAFGLDPKVAMLSYSSGSSGKGEEVEKVRKATDLAKMGDPKLKIEGPIQYDAAVDIGVGQKKMPGSEVAGKASVLIFPDLNTGNNTYKAVQRETGAIAIGPVLQGLNKPVNDLSRGCTVPDIVNTVVITAIQAQNED
ncbi:phosphate acetyltransferase [Marinoscillum sp. MHG1-6]|uniref:phosphate acetyltransferase n=1 Tax=Marinoscillum sp. MHG1-6 TaxID=2959627 RepID=UPI0021589D84|nr:phosphate acetyltransferase [Marinoscillum sp. MHG1-6]